MRRILLLTVLLTGIAACHAQSRKSNGWFVDTSIGCVDKMFTVDVGLHKQLTHSFSLGFTTGAMVSDGCFVLPLLGDLRYKHPFEQSKFSLLGNVRSGFYLDTDDLDYSMVGMEILPGVQYQIDEKVAVRLQIGAIVGIHIDGDFSGDAIPIMVGVSYRL